MEREEGERGGTKRRQTGEGEGLQLVLRSLDNPARGLTSRSLPALDRRHHRLPFANTPPPPSRGLRLSRIPDLVGLPLPSLSLSSLLPFASSSRAPRVSSFLKEIECFKRGWPRAAGGSRSDVSVARFFQKKFRSGCFGNGFFADGGEGGGMDGSSLAAIELVTGRCFEF